MMKTILTTLSLLCIHTWMTAEAIKKHDGWIHWPPLKTNMSAEQVHEWNETLEYLKDALSSYEEWKERKKSEAADSMAAYKEWLSDALQKYKEAKEKEKRQLEEYWNWLQQHHCGGKGCHKTMTSSTPPTSKEEWVSDWKDWLHRRSSHKHHKHSTRPAQPYEDEMQKHIEDFFHRFREENTSDMNEEDNDTETDMKRPAFRDSPVIVPPGNYTAPTIPTQVVYTTYRWWSDPWFWIFHVLGVLIIVVLAAAVCAMRMQKKNDYQRLA